MNIAIVTRSATTHSGSRAPIDLATQLSSFFKVTVLATANNQQKDARELLKKNNVNLIFYKNNFDLYRKLSAKNFDLISFHATLLQMLAAKLTTIPITKTYYGTQFNAYLERLFPNEKSPQVQKLINNIANSIIWLNQKIQLTLANQTIAISEYTQRELTKKFGTKSTLVYLAIDPKRTVNGRWKMEGGKYITLLSVSRFTPYKGFHLIFEAANKLRAKGLKVKVTIAGSTQNSTYYKYLHKLKDPQDAILTNISDKELVSLYKAADIYVSCDHYSFFGLSLLEAAYARLPIIAMNYAAASELIVDKITGYLANSPEDLVSRIEELANNRRRRLNMGTEAQKFALRKFNPKSTSRLYVSIFEKLIKFQ